LLYNAKKTEVEISSEEKKIKEVQCVSVLPTTFTRHYREWHEGDLETQEKLIKLVYRDLCRIARRLLYHEGNAASVQPEMLADDVAVLLLGKPGIGWNDRKHFFLVAAEKMRQLLVDRARHRSAQKRIPSSELIPLDEIQEVFKKNTPNLIDLNEALEELQKIDLQASRIVMLRFFFGSTEEEVADVLGIPLNRVKTDWKMAKLWLRNYLRRQ
jgi:RNA polymerase sigma factor (TIGR02999 family)